MHSMSTKMIIETFQEYFSISSFGQKQQASFYNVLVLHKLYKVCVTQGHDENCDATRRDATRHDATRRDATQRYATQLNATQSTAKQSKLNLAQLVLV